MASKLCTKREKLGISANYPLWNTLKVVESPSSCPLRDGSDALVLRYLHRRAEDVLAMSSIRLHDCDALDTLCSLLQFSNILEVIRENRVQNHGEEAC